MDKDATPLLHALVMETTNTFAACARPPPPITEESLHPHPTGVEYGGVVEIGSAGALKLTIDSSTELQQGASLTFYARASRSAASTIAVIRAEPVDLKARKKAKKKKGGKKKIDLFGKGDDDDEDADVKVREAKLYPTAQYLDHASWRHGSKVVTEREVKSGMDLFEAALKIPGNRVWWSFRAPAADSDETAAYLLSKSKGKKGKKMKGKAEALARKQKKEQAAGANKTAPIALVPEAVGVGAIDDAVLRSAGLEEDDGPAPVTDPAAASKSELSDMPWGFKFLAEPETGEWRREEQVSSAPSLAWACWLLDFLLKDATSLPRGAVHDGRTLEALVRCLRRIGSPAGTQQRVITLLSLLLNAPQMFSTTPDLDALAGVEKRVMSAAQSRIGNGKSSSGVSPFQSAVLPQHLLRLVEMIVTRRSAIQAFESARRARKVTDACAGRGLGVFVEVPSLRQRLEGEDSAGSGGSSFSPGLVGAGKTAEEQYPGSILSKAKECGGLGLGVKPSEEAFAAGGGADAVRGDLVLAAAKSAIDSLGILGTEPEGSDAELEGPAAAWGHIGENEASEWAVAWGRATQGPMINEESLPAPADTPTAVDIEHALSASYDEEDPTDVVEQLQALISVAIVARGYAFKAGIPLSSFPSFSDPRLVVDLYDFMVGFSILRGSDGSDAIVDNCYSEMEALSMWHAIKSTDMADEVREEMINDLVENQGIEGGAEGLADWDVEALCDRMNTIIETYAEKLPDISI